MANYPLSYTTYTQLLENKGMDGYTNLDISFYQYVLDHIPNLQANSTLISPDPDLLSRYKWQPQLYLYKIHSWTFPVWLFLVTNRLDSDLEFTYTNLKNGMYIPNGSYLEALQEDYMSTSYGCITYPVGQGLAGPLEWATTTLLSGLHSGS